VIPRPARGPLVAAGSALLTLLAGCSGGGTATVTGATTTTTPPSTLAATTSTTAPAAVAVGTLGVGTRTDVYVDTTRPTPPNGGAPGSPSRTMPTTVWYPAAVPAGSTMPDAAPDLTRGPYPLVVFAHGYAVTPSTYAALLSRWASAGYVVVAPALPRLNANAPGGATEADLGLPNVSGGAANDRDLVFVLSEALRRSATPGDPLAGLVDPQAVGVAGHSDGEILAYDLSFASCCHDARVRAAIPMAGNLANTRALPEATGVPVLHVMDDHDEYDPYPASIAFDRQYLAAPRYLLTLVSAHHQPPFIEPSDPHFGLVTGATVDFLDAYLKHRADGLAALASLVNGASTLAALDSSPG
jgi:dienelactone hydrolase